MSKSKAGEAVQHGDTVQKPDPQSSEDIEFNAAINDLCGKMGLRAVLGNIDGVKNEHQTALVSLTNIASYFKSQNRMLREGQREKKRPLYLPQHRLVASFEAWANANEIVRPVYVCKPDYQSQLSLLTQNFMDNAYMQRDEARHAGNAPQVEHFTLAITFAKEMQDQMGLSRGKEARSGLQPISFPPMKKMYPN